jgi:hypothetical protein
MVLRTLLPRFENHIMSTPVIQELAKAASLLGELKKEFFAANQDRSMYQLEKFVVGAQDTPERQYLQVMGELWNCYCGIRGSLLELEELDIKCSRLSQIEDVEMRELTRKRFALKRECIEYQMDGQLKEFSKLWALKQKIPSFTNEQIEEAEKSYYEKRLERQALEDRASDVFKINVGNLRALDQAGILKIQSEGNQMRLVDVRSNGHRLE